MLDNILSLNDFETDETVKYLVRLELAKESTRRKMSRLNKKVSTSSNIFNQYLQEELHYEQNTNSN